MIWKTAFRVPSGEVVLNEAIFAPFRFLGILLRRLYSLMHFGEGALVLCYYHNHAENVTRFLCFISLTGLEK